MEKLQYISSGNSIEEHISNITKASKNGVKWVQLRLKKYSEKEIKEAAMEVKSITKRHNVTFILNDYLHIAKELNLDGVHLGKNDFSVLTAKEQLGKNKIIGATANTFEDIVNAYNQGASYIGLGPFWFTTTKENLSPVLGIDGYKKILSELKINSINLPIYAIGGIQINNISTLMKTGISGIAVSSLISKSENKKETIRQIFQQLQ